MQGTVFALQVAGDSMQDAGIMEGDRVIVRQTSTARDGDIVVATLDGETTIKRLRLGKEQAMLVAENPAYRPIEIRADNAVIQGVVIGLMRSYQDTALARHSSGRRTA